MRKQSQLFEEVVRELIGVFAVEVPHYEVRATHRIIFRTKYDWLFISIIDRTDTLEVSLVEGKSKVIVTDAYDFQGLRSLMVSNAGSVFYTNRIMAHTRNLKKALA